MPHKEASSLDNRDLNSWSTARDRKSARCRSRPRDVAQTSFYFRIDMPQFLKGLYNIFHSIIFIIVGKYLNIAPLVLPLGHFLKTHSSLSVPELIY